MTISRKMSPACRVQIRITDLSVQGAEAVMAALAPDNVAFPPGQEMEMSIDGSDVRISVGGGAIPSLVATVDEVLAHAQAALEATQG